MDVLEALQGLDVTPRATAAISARLIKVGETLYIHRYRYVDVDIDIYRYIFACTTRQGRGDWNTTTQSFLVMSWRKSSRWLGTEVF